MKKIILPLLLAAMIISDGHSQANGYEIPLYGNQSVPGNLPGPDHEETGVSGDITVISGIKNPTLRIFLPPAEKATGTAVIICPGGGYRIVAIDHEGYEVAKALNASGIAAFVVKYRIPNVENQSNPAIAPLQDAQQALWYARKNAAKFNLNVDKIGIIGFSAGGHLASSVGVHFKERLAGADDSISLRPDFMVLLYPVISSDKSIWHEGSFVNLLGNNSSSDRLTYFSSEKQVTTETPPTFLVHASDDKTVNPENSIRFYEALLKNNVPAELHIYQNGGHGFGLHNKTTTDNWLDRCINWMKENNW